MTTSKSHWETIRSDLASKRRALAEAGHLVVSSKVYFPAGTDLSYKRADLSSFSTAEIETELKRRNECALLRRM